MHICEELQEIWKIITWWKNQNILLSYCCHILSESLLLWPQLSWIQWKDQRRRPVGVGVFDLIRAVPTSTCHCLSCPTWWNYCLCSLPMNIPDASLERKQLSHTVFYFQILSSAAKMECTFHSNYQFHK